MGFVVTREEKQVRNRYRVVSEPSWRVLGFVNNQWLTIWYCSSEDSAKKAMEKSIQQTLESMKMTHEEWIKHILRDTKTS